MSDTNRIEDLLYEGFQPPPSGVAFKLKEILATFKAVDGYLDPESETYTLYKQVAIEGSLEAEARKQLAKGISQLEQAIRSLENLNR